MRRYRVLLIVVCLGVTAMAAREMTFTEFAAWHTTPGKWERPRSYHTPFDPYFSPQIRIGRDIVSVPATEKTWSPNDAYWFMGNYPDTSKEGPWNTTISVFNERQYLVQITFLDHRYLPKARWINEKLLYLEVWWGRVVGTEIIFDVEQEKTIYQEMICDGTNAWQQWQEGLKWQEALKSQRFHLVRQGETLSGISYKYYGSTGQWRKIFEANRGTVQDANTVRSGTKLIIPD